MATPVVVLNMHYSGLGIARSLAPHGIPVYGLSAYSDFPGSSSRYCRFVRSPDTLHQPDEMLAFLLRFASRLSSQPILLPTRDHDIEFLLSHREELEQCYTIPLASRDVIKRTMNKEDCAAIAQSCGVSVPKSFTVNDEHGLQALRGKLVFPAIVKPLYAHQWRRPGIWQAVRQQKAIRVDRFDELAEVYRRVSPFEATAVVQQYIPGPDSSLLVFGSYCRPGGEVRAYFTGRKLLQVPPLRGTGVIVEGLPLPEVVEPSRTLLRALDFRGMSEIEYKRHAVNGDLYLIEINPRHWDQHELGTICGVNLSLELYRDLTDRSRLQRDSSRPPPTQRVDSVRWIAERELLHYAISAIPAGETSIAELRTLMRRPRRYAVCDAADPLPGARNLLHVARDVARRVANRQGRRTVE